uniref:Uncharacterized protein n=1 Tax=Theropithecus gelada TaxID=9565 RepID=A0A8D2G493_THEGE
MTTLIPVLSTFLFEDFSKASGFKGQRPETLHERLSPVSVYALYLLIPFVLLMFMLQSPYKYEEKRRKKMKQPLAQGKRCLQGGCLLDTIRGTLLRTHILSSI